LIDSPKRPGPGAAKLSGDGGLKPESVLYMFMICYWKWSKKKKRKKWKRLNVQVRRIVCWGGMYVCFSKNGDKKEGLPSDVIM